MSGQNGLNLIWSEKIKKSEKLQTSLDVWKHCTDDNI